MCMSFVAVGRSLTIVSYVTFKMAALWFWTMFNCNPPIAHCHPLLWGGGILVDHWSTIFSYILCHFNYLWHDTGSWNHSSCMTRLYLFYKVNIMTADDLVTQEARHQQPWYLLCWTHTSEVKIPIYHAKLKNNCHVKYCSWRCATTQKARCLYAAPNQEHFWWVLILGKCCWYRTIVLNMDISIRVLNMKY